MIIDFLTKDEIYTLRKNLEEAVNDQSVIDQVADKIVAWLQLHEVVKSTSSQEKGLRISNSEELESEIEDLESKVEDLEDEIADLESTVRDLKRENSKLIEKLKALGEDEPCLF